MAGPFGDFMHEVDRRDSLLVHLAKLRGEARRRMHPSMVELQGAE